MASVMAWGAGVAVAAFLVRSLISQKSFQQLFRKAPGERIPHPSHTYIRPHGIHTKEKSPKTKEN